MKEKKNQKKLSMLTTLLLTLTLIMLAVGALAKYVTTSNNNAEAQVAKWSFKVNGEDGSSQNFILENTIDDNDFVERGYIAPGTSGHFSIRLDGRGSETAINYIINMDLENNPMNMRFYMDEAHTIELPVNDGNIVINDFIPLPEVENGSGSKTNVAINEIKDATIYWDWPFETGNTEEEIYKNNIQDTKDSGKRVNVNVTVTGIQTLPDAPVANYEVYYYLENANDDGFSLYTQSTKIYNKNTDSELSLINIANDIFSEDTGDIRYAKYAYGKTNINGEKVSNVNIAEDGSTKIYLYYVRDRYTLTTKAGENIKEVTSTGLSTGTSHDYADEDGEFVQNRKVMKTKYKWGEEITITADLEEAEGYTSTFTNWMIAQTQENTTPNLSTRFNNTQKTTTVIMPKENVEVTANAGKTANSYSVIFDENNGTGIMSPQNYTYDIEQALKANEFTRTGYTFKSWNTSKDGTGQGYENEQIVKNLATSGTVKLYAQWEANEYILVFNANGGNGTMANQTFKYDERKAIQTNKFTRQGYTFAGWNVAEDGTNISSADGENILNLSNLFNLQDTPGAEIILYAQWNANNYIVAFNSNGATGSETMENQVFTYDVGKALSANVFTKTGYTFAGWSTSKNGGVVYTNRQVVSNLVAEPNGTITLYAIWTKNSYNVAYNSNSQEGTTGTMANSIFTYDTTERLKQNVYERTGYTFKNWNTKQDGTGAEYSNKAEVRNLVATPNGTVTLYAQWTANTYTINYNKNVENQDLVSGTMQSTNCTYDETILLRKNVFNRTGYRFIGWSIVSNPTAEESKIYNDEEPVVNLVAENNGQITLYAQWEANTNTAYIVEHYIKDTNGNYVSTLTENLVGTTDAELILSNLVKTTNQYNVPNGIYFKKLTANGNTIVEVSPTVGNEKTETTIQELTGKKATIKPDGSLHINIYYERTYGKLTVIAGENVANVSATENGSTVSINNRQFYYGENVPVLTATMNYETGYLINFAEWTSSNRAYLPSITANPSEAFSWPAMPSNTSITLTANATKTESTDIQYKVNYYIEDANGSEYVYRNTVNNHGRTNAQITEAMVATEIANCTFHHSNITESTIIEPDGSAEVNVYYTRNTFTLNVIGSENIAGVKVSTQGVENVDNEAPILITKTLKWGANVSIEATIENLLGYTYNFTGWTTASTANLGAGYGSSEPSTTIIMPAENIQITATASKTANTYKIKFNSNAGSGTMADEQFTYNEAKNLTANNFTKLGYTFQGWATDGALESIHNETITLEQAIQGKVTANSGVLTSGQVVVFANEAQILNLTTTNNQTINLHAIWKDETAPVLTLDTTKTTNSIEVKVTAVEQGSGLAGNYKYYIGTKQQVADGLGGTTEEIVYEEAVEKAGTTHIFEELLDNTTYYIKVEKADNAGNVGVIADKPVTTNILEGVVTFTDAYWSNGKYIVMVNTEAVNESGDTYQMQYQVLTAEEIEELKAQGKTDDEITAGVGVEEEKWAGEIISSGEILGNERVDVANGARQTEPEKSVANLVLKDGDIVYVRIYDGVNGADEYYSYSIINPSKKTYTETELAQVQYGVPTYEILGYETTTNSFKVNIEKEITGTELYNYYAKSSSEDEYKLISTSSNWSDMANVSNELLAKTTLNGEIQLAENETYKVKVLTRKANGTVTQCLNTATMIVQEGAQIGPIYAQNRTYVDVQNHTAIIPAGFKVSNAVGEDKIANGMVLKDANNNEFVWVPVNQAKYVAGVTAIPTNTSSTTTYYKPMSIAQTGNECYQSIVYTYDGIKSYRNTSSTGLGNTSYREPSLITGNIQDPLTWDMLLPGGQLYDTVAQNYQNTLGFESIQEFGVYMNKEYTNMVNSTDTYGGFYISRYEASIESERVQSKPNKAPMSNINWYQLYKNSDSNRNANNTYYSTGSVTSSMVWGSQYDAMLNWIITGTNKSDLQATNYGNKTNEQSLTGQYSDDIINNIYDLVGNTYEWTQEAYNATARVNRGGSYNSLKGEKATSRATVAIPSGQGPAYGTRLTLYINNSSGSSKVPVVNIVKAEATANTITVKVATSGNGSGISKYCYSVKETDGATWTTYESYSPEYTIMGLTQSTLYTVKVQVRDNSGNMSNVAIMENVQTEGVTLENGAIYIVRTLGASGDGSGKMYLGVSDNYASQGYHIEYQVVLGNEAISSGRTANASNGVYLTLNASGTWITGEQVTGLYEEDKVYARLSDGTNTTPWTYFEAKLERFSGISNSVRTYTDKNGDTATIPAGFEYGISDGINLISDGLVIRDANKNEFVWVPVESAIADGRTYPKGTNDTSTYKPMAVYQDGSPEYYQSLIYIFSTGAKALSYANTGWKLGTGNYREPSVVTGSGDDGYTWNLDGRSTVIGASCDAAETYYKTDMKFNSANECGNYKNEEYKNMIESVEYYKGFYMGRYETSADSNYVVQSQPNKDVLNTKNSNSKGYKSIYYQDSNRNPQNPYYGNTTVTSSMMWNAQYDAMLNWFLQKSSNKDQVFSNTLGNHKQQNVPDKTGVNIDDITNNIFDLGGNIQEYTLGSQGTTGYITRGGNFNKNTSYPGTSNMTYIRASWEMTTSDDARNIFGTRMSLYLTKPNDTSTLPTIDEDTITLTRTTNSIKVKVKAHDGESGIEKYYYYIKKSSDADFGQPVVGWGNSYTFTSLIQSTSYDIKVQVENKAGEVSNCTAVMTKETNAIGVATDILTPMVYGENGNGHVYFELNPSYEQQGYYVETQIVTGGGTFNPNGQWLKSDSRTVSGRSAGDTVYARVNDGKNLGNISEARVWTVEITELETYSEVYTTTTAYTDNGKTAYIPAGFKVGTSDNISHIDTGLVIKNATTGDEFVWVPVNNVIYDGRTVGTNGADSYKPMVRYQKNSDQFYEMVRYDYNKGWSTGSKVSSVNSGIINTQLNTTNYREPSLITNHNGNLWWQYESGTGYDADSRYYSTICHFTSPTQMGEYMNEEYTNMVNSVNQYKGFYIGRYETSLDSSKTVVKSQISQTPMNSTTSSGNLWYGLYYKQDSKRNSSNPYYGSSSVVSSMIWGSQYDAMLNWVLTSENTKTRNKIFERTGNHSNNPKATGSYGSDIINNIFDLAANELEWTQEANSTYYRVRRGGTFLATIANVPITRNSYNPTGADTSYGSRLALYIVPLTSQAE